VATHLHNINNRYKSSKSKPIKNLIIKDLMKRLVNRQSLKKKSQNLKRKPMPLEVVMERESDIVVTTNRFLRELEIPVRRWVLLPISLY